MRLDPFIYRMAELRAEDGHLVFGVNIDQYIKTLLSHKTHAIVSNGIQVGGAVMSGDRFHIAIIPEFRGMVSFQIVRAVEWGLSISNPFKAIVRKDRSEVRRLIDFFPNKLVGQDDNTLTFEIKPRGML